MRLDRRFVAGWSAYGRFTAAGSTGLPRNERPGRFRCPDRSLSRWIALGRSDVAILYSPVSAAELWAGARPAEHAALTGLFGALSCVPIDAEIGRLGGEFLRRYRKSHAVELGDALIGASAVLNGAILWTRNRKRYPMKELAFFE